MVLKFSVWYNELSSEALEEILIELNRRQPPDRLNLPVQMELPMHDHFQAARSLFLALPICKFRLQRALPRVRASRGKLIGHPPLI